MKELKRKLTRLKDYDYPEPGAYFVTICTQDKKHLFGGIVNGEMQLNQWGEIIKEEWLRTATIRANVELDEFVVMPNLDQNVGAGPCARPETNHDFNPGQPRGVAPTLLSLPDVVHRFKSLTTHRYSQGVKQNGWKPFDGKLWQRNYYEHVIRDEHELFEMRQYIQENPLKWDLDPENLSYAHTDH